MQKIQLSSPFKKQDGALVHHAYRGADLIGKITEVYRDVYYVTASPPAIGAARWGASGDEIVAAVAAAPAIGMNETDTNDFILADYLADCLVAYDRAATRNHAAAGYPARFPKTDLAI